jgi:uncharacterized protein (TIGR00251 family)
MGNQKEPESLISILPVRITPRAKQNEISELMADGTIKIRLTAPPVDGKANLALVDFLSDVLNIRTSRIELISGMKGRDKRVRIDGSDRQTLYRRIKQHLQQGEAM